MEDITFSLFKGYADTLPAEATLSEIIRMIRQDPTVKLHTLKHRYYASQGNAAAADSKHPLLPNCLKPFGLQKISKIGKRG